MTDAPGLARRLAAEHGGELHYTYQHALKGFAATLPAQALEAVRRNPNVAYVEQDGVVRATDIQSNATWGLDRIDQRDLPLTGTYAYNNTGAGVTAYIIDSGIETSHSEFGSRASSGKDFVDGGTADDCYGHGTHVAGTVGGATYGVAKQVGLVAVRVLDCDGEGKVSDAIAGVDWVTGNRSGPSVANMSLGADPSDLLDQAVRNSIASGVTYVISAGNYGDDACNYSPARVGEALTVGATNSSDNRAFFSNVGSCIDLFAPGVAITSAWLSGGTNTIDGTSMAAPHVAGAAARYLQDNPAASPATVNAAIVNAATTGKVVNAGTGSPNRLLYIDPGTPPSSGDQDQFDSNTLGQYTIYNTPGAWSISGGYLHASSAAQQSVVIRNGQTMGNGWVETETDEVTDGGLVLRFQSSGSYYLLAIRDDSRWGNLNLDIFRAQGGTFTHIAGPVDVSFPAGVRATVRFEASGSTLKAYLNGVQQLSVTDATYASGGFGLRHNGILGEPDVTSRFDLVRWGATAGTPPSGDRDLFDSNTLGQYTIYNTPGAWSISGGYLHASSAAQQSVVIRNGQTMGNGWVETETDQVKDGGLVLRFQSSGSYYLLAIRDDSRWGNLNLDIFRAQGGTFTHIAGPVDVSFPAGVRATVRFEASGSTLKAYLNGVQQLSVTDATYASGGFGLRHNGILAEPDVTSRFDLVRWGATAGTPPSGDRDLFDSNTLGQYTIYNTPGAWSISGGYLHASSAAQQSVVIRNGQTMGNGWVETETDEVTDGGLVLRFQSSGSYYLLAIRDDSRWGNLNLDIFRAQGGTFTHIAGPVDVSFPAGVRATVRFEASGSTLKAYLNGVQQLSVTDATYASGGFGLRHNGILAEPDVTSRFDLFSWNAF